MWLSPEFLANARKSAVTRAAQSQSREDERPRAERATSTDGGMSAQNTRGEGAAAAEKRGTTRMAGRERRGRGGGGAVEAGWTDGDRFRRLRAGLSCEEGIGPFAGLPVRF